MEQFDILIVGGGMVGSALAVALSGSSHSVALLEREVPQPVAPGEPCALRVSAINPASERLLRRLGVWHKLLASGRVQPFTHMRITERGQSASLELDASDGRSGQLGHIVENSLLQRALWEQAEAEGGVALVTGNTRDLIWSPDGSTLTLEDGRRLGARLLIGADGAGSMVRRAAGIGCDRLEYPQHCLVIAVRLREQAPPECWQVFRPQGPLALLPLPERQASLCWYDHPDRIRSLLMLDADELQDEVAREFGLAGNPPVEILARGAFPLAAQHARRYGKAGVLLAGDAAHTIHPLAGQGVNLGLQDVEVLADLLRDCPGEELNDQALVRRYEARRRMRNLATQAAMDILYRGFSHQSLPLRMARGFGLWLAERSGPLKAQAVRFGMGF